MFCYSISGKHIAFFYTRHDSTTDMAYAKIA